MDNEDIVVVRHSVKLNVRLDPLLSHRRAGEGLSARLTAICDRFSLIYEAHSARVRALFSGDEMEQLVDACSKARPQAGWLTVFIEKTQGNAELQKKLAALSTLDVVVLEEMLAVATSS